jgi:hypothetical protein
VHLYTQYLSAAASAHRSIHTPAARRGDMRLPCRRTQDHSHCLHARRWVDEVEDEWMDVGDAECV